MDKDKKKRTVSRFPRWKNVELNGCYIRLGLDTRHQHNIEEVVPVSVIIQKGKEIYYHHLPFKVTRAQYDTIFRSTGRGRNSGSNDAPYAQKRKIEDLFDNVIDKLQIRFSDQAFSPKSAELALQGKEIERSPSSSLTELWKEVASNPLLSLNTRESYESARKSFIMHLGERGGFVYTAEEIREWMDQIVQKSKNNRKTTSGIYARSLKVVINEAISRGYLSSADNPFSQKGIIIPRGAERKDQSLTVKHMTKLYKIFLNRDFPADWQENQRKVTETSLGLFLAQYLCNGCNMTDLARLRYNEHYFKSDGQSFSFIRQKTARRNDTDQEVIIPIIEPLKVILDRLESSPKKDTLVFPQVLRDAKTEKEVIQRVSQMNKNIRRHINSLVQHLGWTELPGGAWCRHSYGSNLAEAGVPQSYIHQSMGHKVAVTDVTERYFKQFSHETQCKYNNLLLDLSSPNLEGTVTISKEQFEEYKKLMMLQSRAGKE